jgi:hypothetical protein
MNNPTDSLFAPRSDGSMNKRILGEYNAKRNDGLLAGGQMTSTSQADPGKRDQLTALLSEREVALDTDDAALLAYAEARIDALVEGARTPAPERDDAGRFAESSDQGGGVRGSTGAKPTPGGTREPSSMNDLIRAAAGRF